MTVELAFQGGEPEGMRKLFAELSETDRLKDMGASSLGTVRRLANGDHERFIKALHSEGYYAAAVTIEIVAEADAYRAKFLVEPGPQYNITQHLIEYTDEASENRPSSAEEAGVETGLSSRGSDILAVQNSILQRLRSNGYPLARVVERRAEARTDSPEATIVYVTESGALAHFGPVQWPEGLNTHTDYLEGFVPWQQGERYDLAKAEAFRDELAETELFTSVSVEPGKVDANGLAPVMVTLVERKARTIGVGLSYSTNLGFGVTASWVHRNLLRRAERLTADLSVAEQLQELSFGFTKPRLVRKTDLVTNFTARAEDTEAFTGTTFVTAAELQHEFSERLTGRAGPELYASDIEDSFGSRRSYLVGFPIGATWTNANSVLNPTSGLNISASIKPYAGASDGAVSFAQFEGTTSYHWPIDDEDQFVAALWGRLGASIGPSIAEIPSDKRFYAGGGGSVRGYGYRLIGPTDADGDPVGGRSVVEFGTELRFPVRGKVGGAVFVEGGGVSPSGLFAFDEGVRYGAGVGIRYYTPIGPVRADLAVPLDRRDGIDDPFQFYIGLGQAF